MASSPPSPPESAPGAAHAGSVPGLPVQLSSFIGREREVAAVRQWLGTTRLLTLTGAGGSGKTRLALEVATQVAGAYPGGLVWVELAALSDPELLPQQIGAALGIREEGGRSAAGALSDFLRERSLLVVLDNCEHLADACAALAETLLRGAPGLTILATSREALGVPGERAWLVPPLSLPAEDRETALEQLAGFEAVQLFLQRAQDVLPSFRLTEENAAAVAQICRRLDGIPLAIELAAARVKVLAPEQIAQRLDDAFALLTSGSRTALPRHRTLRAAIDWSHALLSEPERLLMKRLSIFAGGFTLEAAEVVCADERLECREVLDVLARLVDRSLVGMREHAGAARYHLLETMRQYAFARLEEAGEAAGLQRRHAELFLALVEEAEPHLTSPRRHPWIARLRAEHDNLRAALAWSAQAAGETNVRMAGALYWFWFHLGFWSEGSRWLTEALALPAARERGAARANALLAAGTLAFWRGDAATGQRWLEESRDLWGELGDPRRQGHASIYSGMCTLALSRDPARAQPSVDAAIAIFESLDDPWWLSHARNAAGALLLLRQEVAQASEQYRKSAALTRELGENLGLGIALHGLAETARRQGDVGRALEALREALVALRHEHDDMFIARTLETLAFLVLDQDDARGAARFIGAARALREGVGAPVIGVLTLLHGESVAAIRARLGEEAFAAALAEGRALTREQAVALALGEPGSGETPAVARADAAAGAAEAGAASGDGEPGRPSPAAAGDAPRGAPALRVLALGPLEIWLQGTLLPDDAWHYSRPRELLLYLLAHPAGRTREQIGLVFWPESSAAQVKNSFHVTLHHLRRTLGGNDWIVLENDRYRLSPEREIEVDAAVFERRMTGALREARAGAGSAERLRAALALYRGDFLQDELVGDWHLELRDRLGRLYGDGLLALGELLLQAEQWAEAAAVFQQVVRREELREEGHRRLMLCLARAGERGQALRHYDRLVTLLREELGVEPEAETTALYERLRQSVPL
jgi:predicted ATPase/DNA-binding SARP family transcriptional activator